MRKVFIHADRCIGCRQCEFACATEHSVSKDYFTAFLETPTPQSRIHVDPGPVPSLSYPNNCRHCNPAPCVRICPSGAMMRVAEDRVDVDPELCIGCAMCAVVCPFDVIQFGQVSGTDVPVAIKCDLCPDRLAEGREPACVEACMVDALEFGDVNEMVERVRQTGSVQMFALAAAEQPADPLAAWRDCSAAEANVTA